MPRFHRVYDAKTGETTDIPFTAAEEAKQDAEEAAWLAGKPARDVAAIQSQRVAESPKIGDQLDAIWKQLEQDRSDGKILTRQADDTLNDIRAIDLKYPMPE